MGSILDHTQSWLYRDMLIYVSLALLVVLLNVFLINLRFINNMCKIKCDCYISDLCSHCNDSFTLKAICIPLSTFLCGCGLLILNPRKGNIF